MGGLWLRARAGPVREQLLAMRVEALDGVVYTHDHADHTHGIDDLRQIRSTEIDPVVVADFDPEVEIADQARAIGTREFVHSRETWSMRERASSGNVSSYWRHSLPSVCFHLMLASMP